MFTTNNNFKVFVSNVDTILTYSSATSPGVDLSGATTGQILPLNGNGQYLNAASVTAPESLKIAMLSGNGVMSFSDTFKVKDIIALSSEAYNAGSEQVTYVGYNGTSGAINAIDYNEYILSLIYKHDDMMWSEQINIKPYLVTTESGAKASTVATQFAKMINADEYSKVKAAAVCSAPYTSTNGTKSGQESTVVNGSTTITFETDLGYGTGSALITVGDYIRIGTPAGIAGTPTVQSSVYKVIATPTSTTVTVDRPVTEASGTYEDIGTGTQLEVIPAATAEAASWGIKFTGLVLDWVAKGVFPYKQVAFDVTLKGFGSTTQSTTAASLPKGNYKQVSDLEWFSQFGSDGLRNAMQHPVPTGKADTDLTTPGTYKCYTIRYKTTSENDPIVGQSNMTATIYIFIKSTCSTVIGYWDTTLTTLATAAGIKAI